MEPNFITRAEWGARPPKGVQRFATVRYIYDHHTTGQTLGANQTDRWVRNIQEQHMDANGWSDIGYSFLYDYYGNIFEGRGWNVVGAHTLGHNSEGHGFAYLGDGSLPLSQSAWEALKWLTAESDRRFGAVPILGHRDVYATACPGEWIENNKPRQRGEEPILMPPGTLRYDPPVILEPIVSSWVPPEGGLLQLGISGAIYAWGGAQYRGGANGKAYFAGRHAHHIEAPDPDAQAVGKVYCIVATSKERYNYPE